MNKENKEIEKIADEISFRLLATRNHEDYEWLHNRLEDFKYPNVKTEHPFIAVFRKYRNLFFKSK
tara:strand:+ start:453 stop:647 length:195 start_codon:yes stop_codon:yes gene_type:complete